MNRRPCLDIGWEPCERNRPPRADYPSYSLGSTTDSDLLNVDIKVPGEHTLEGVAFDAEIQMLHTHLGSGRVSSIGLPVRAKPGGFNHEFQQLLDVFQEEFDLHLNECRLLRKLRRTKRNLRRSRLFFDGGDQASITGNENTRDRNKTTEENYWSSSSPASYREELERIKMEYRVLYNGNNNETARVHGDNEKDQGRQQRILQEGTPQSRRFNPYSEAFMPSIFFYRYDGSMTEPPCMDITWWVMYDPMTISLEQLDQVKRILFTHVDPDCTPTSVHNAGQSVARPIYPLGEDRDIQLCDPKTFRSDMDKGKVKPANKCAGY